MYQHTTATPIRKKMPSKLIAGLAAFLATGIITASGLAGAAPNPSNSSQWTSTYQNASINNGYGGGNTSVINNISLNINGNNNIYQIIVQIFN